MLALKVLFCVSRQDLKAECPREGQRRKCSLSVRIDFLCRQLGVLGLTSGGKMSTTRHHLPNMTLPRVPYSDTLFFAVLHDLIPNHLYVASYAALP